METSVVRGVERQAESAWVRQRVAICMLAVTALGAILSVAVPRSSSTSHSAAPAVSSNVGSGAPANSVRDAGTSPVPTNSSNPIQTARPLPAVTVTPPAPKPTKTTRPIAWWEGGSSPGYPGNRLEVQVTAMLGAIQACYAPYQASAVDHSSARWDVMLDGRGEITAVRSVGLANAIPALNNCVTSVIRERLKMGPPWDERPVVIEIDIGAPEPPK